MSEHDNMFLGVVVPAAIVEEGAVYAKAQAVNGKKVNPQNAVKAVVERILADHLQRATAVGEIAHSTEGAVTKPLSETTLEDASKVILSQLDPEHRNFLYQLASDSGRPLSSYVLSPILLAKEHGNTNVLLGQWADATKAHGEVCTITPDSKICEYSECKKSFKPERRDQKYCPPPADGSEPCGRMAGLAEIRKLRAPKIVSRAYGEQVHGKAVPA